MGNKEFWLHSAQGLFAILIVFVIPLYFLAVELKLNLALVAILGGITITAIRNHLSIMDKKNRN